MVQEGEQSSYQRLIEYRADQVAARLRTAQVAEESFVTTILQLYSAVGETPPSEQQLKGIWDQVQSGEVTLEKVPELLFGGE